MLTTLRDAWGLVSASLVPPTYTHKTLGFLGKIEDSIETSRLLGKRHLSPGLSDAHWKAGSFVLPGWAPVSGAFRIRFELFKSGLTRKQRIRGHPKPSGVEHTPPHTPAYRRPRRPLHVLGPSGASRRVLPCPVCVGTLRSCLRFLRPVPFALGSTYRTLQAPACACVGNQVASCRFSRPGLSPPRDAGRISRLPPVTSLRGFSQLIWDNPGIRPIRWLFSQEHVCVSVASV